MLLVFRAVFALCLLAWSTSARAEPVKELSHRDRLYGAAEVNGTIFVVGHPGILMRSTNGGASFERVAGGQHEEALFAIAFNRKGQGAVVGRSGFVLTTPDAGKTWQKSVVTFDEEKPSLFSVSVLEDGTIVAVGEFGTIARSDDQGKTWSRSSFQTEYAPKVKKRAEACASSQGAEDAVRVAQPSSMEDENADMLPEARLTGVSFFKNGPGLVVGEFGLVLRSEDGGRTFTRQAGCSEPILYAVTTWGDKNALAVGADGVIIESADGGVSWTPKESGTPEHLFAVDANEHFALALGAAGAAVVRKDGGAFKPTDTGLHSWLSGAVLDDQGKGVLVGARGHVGRTSDGGKTQQKVLGE